MCFKLPFPHQFISDWIQTAKKGKINKTHLLVLFYHRQNQTSIRNFQEIFFSIEDSLNRQIGDRYTAILIDNIDKNTKIVKNKNIVIISINMSIDPRIFSIIDFPILYCLHGELIDTIKYLDGEVSNTIKHLEKEQSDIVEKHIPIIENFFEIKKTDPIQIIKEFNFSYVEYKLFHLIYTRVLMKHMFKMNSKFDYYFSNTSLYVFPLLNLAVVIPDYGYLCDIILIDSKLFKDKILTARLAKLIYKLSTLNFNDSDTKIGLFYRDKFKTSSKSFHISKKLCATGPKIKVYDLNNF